MPKEYGQIFIKIKNNKEKKINQKCGKKSMFFFFISVIIVQSPPIPHYAHAPLRETKTAPAFRSLYLPRGGNLFIVMTQSVSASLATSW